MSLPNTIYKIANFISSNTHCPIEKLEIQEKSDFDAPKIISELNDSEISIQMPDYKTLTQNHSFTVKATAKEEKP